jgi:hypothetical protein
MENPASSILSVSSFSHDSVKHMILLSRWSDSFNRKLSSLFSNNCTLAYYTEGSVRLPTHRQILTRHPALLPLFLCLFFTRMTGIWAWSRERSISILLYSFIKFEVSTRCSDVQKLFSVIRDGSSNIMYKMIYKR